jgi:hypothetical protein
MNSAKTLLVLVGLVLVPRSHAQDWPQFRGPTGQGISTDKGVQLNW